MIAKKCFIILFLKINFKLKTNKFKKIFSDKPKNKKNTITRIIIK